MAAEMLDMFKDNPENVGALVRAIGNSVSQSFVEDRSRKTSAETKRRVEMCVSIARQLRRDLKWSVTRICDEMPFGLRCQLDGIPWDPNNRRTLWTPPQSKLG
jgi:hypothetical protein